MYIHVPTQTYPVKEHQIKAQYPNTSFAKPFVPPSDYEKVVVTEQPAYDAIYQTLQEDAPVLVGDNWVQQWSVRDATREEILSRIPSVVTMRQGRLAMLQTPYGDTNLLAMIDPTLAAIENPIQRQAAQIDWEFAAEINRGFPLVQQLSSALGLTEEQLDDLFKLAATL